MDLTWIQHNSTILQYYLGVQNWPLTPNDPCHWLLLDFFELVDLLLRGCCNQKVPTWYGKHWQHNMNFEVLQPQRQHISCMLSTTLGMINAASSWGAPATSHPGLYRLFQQNNQTKQLCGLHLKGPLLPQGLLREMSASAYVPWFEMFLTLQDNQAFGSFEHQTHPHFWLQTSWKQYLASWHLYPKDETRDDSHVQSSSHVVPNRPRVVLLHRSAAITTKHLMFGSLLVMVATVWEDRRQLGLYGQIPNTKLWHLGTWQYYQCTPARCTAVNKKYGETLKSWKPARTPEGCWLLNFEHTINIHDISFGVLA